MFHGSRLHGQPLTDIVVSVAVAISGSEVVVPILVTVVTAEVVVSVPVSVAVAPAQEDDGQLLLAVSMSMWATTAK